DTVENRRLRLAMEMHTHEIQAWHRAAAVPLDGKSHLVEHREVDPAVGGAITAGPDHRADAFPRDVQLGTRVNLHRQTHLPPNTNASLTANIIHPFLEGRTPRHPHRH